MTYLIRIIVFWEDSALESIISEERRKTNSSRRAKKIESEDDCYEGA